MSGLEALLITSVEDEIPLYKIFPFNYPDIKTISELLVISQHFKNCGKGSLQHQNKIFYYRTYTPTLPLKKDNNNSNESLNDYYIYSYDCSKKKFFLLFLCDLNYKKSNIDKLTNDIFDILDNNSFEGHNIKLESCHKINTLFEQYKKLQQNFGKYNQLTDIKIINDSTDSINSNDTINDSSLNKNKKTNSAKKRIDSRLVMPTTKKQNKSSGFSVDLDDLTSIKESDTDLSIMFKKNIENELNIPIIHNWKIIKIVNIIFCFLFLMIMIIIILFFI